ncbi:MAG: copper chaperone PCu(A)C [Rhodospirillales bacterium]|nr:copper chaperone PCu(A)C [Rhodospirillales bacterium]
MIRSLVRRAVFGVLLLVGSLVAVQAGTIPEPGNIHVGYPWARSSDGSVAVYMTLADEGSKGGRLLDAATPVATYARLYRSSNADGIEKQHLLDAIAIPPGGTLLFRPGGLHVRLTGLKEPLVKGATFPLTLYFASGARATIRIPVAN